MRSERALRATAPIWLAQQAAWGESADLLANIADTVSWLFNGPVLSLASAFAPLARLLLSCAATELKAARVAGLQPGPWIFRFLTVAAVPSDASVALSATVVCLLIPRLAATLPTVRSPLNACDVLLLAGNMCRDLATCRQAIRRSGYSLTSLSIMTSCHMLELLSRSVTEATLLSEATRPQAHHAVKSLAVFANNATQISMHIIALQKLGHGLPPAEFLARLAQPILTLLHSPLLGLLASLQHVAIDSCASVNSWKFPESCNIPSVHQLPAHLEPDAVDSKLAMLVSHSFSLVLTFNC